MRIGIDASRITVRHLTGTEHYARQVIRYLLRQPGDDRFRLYFNREPGAGLLERTANAEWRAIPAARLWTHGRLSLEMLLRPPDVLFVPAHALPLIRPRASVVTVHDVGYRHFPWTHQRRDRWQLDLVTAFSCRTARRIIAPSHSAKRDVEREYGVSPERIRVVYHGVDEDMAPVQEPELLAAARARYGIRSDYLLFVGTLHQRKNVGRIVDAFTSHLERARRPLTLVLAGRASWLPESLKALLERLEAEGTVVRPGYVAREDVPALYSGATGLVFPSLHEGFGLPAPEAMACGTPVIASNTSSLPEVVGDAGLLVDPLDTAAIADALSRLAEDAELRAALSARGLARARAFSWERCAQETLGLLREASML